MAQKQLITRTVAITTVTALCIDIETAESRKKVFEVSGIFNDEKKLLRVIKSEYDTDTFKIVSIVDFSLKECLYGMDIDHFLQYAVQLDPKTRKPINN